jgi:hypothetical protein
MRRHIPELLATGCFVGASFARAAANRYRIRYDAVDQASVDRYVAEHAARLRKDFVDHFPQGVEVSRENWQTLGTWRP